MFTEDQQNDGNLNVPTDLDVDDEDVVLGGRDDGGERRHEAAQQRRQEGARRRVVEAHRDGVVQHGVRDEAHEELRNGAHLVDPVCKTNATHISGWTTDKPPSSSRIPDAFSRSPTQPSSTEHISRLNEPCAIQQQ